MQEYEGGKGWMDKPLVRNYHLYEKNHVGETKFCPATFI